MNIIDKENNKNSINEYQSSLNHNKMRESINNIPTPILPSSEKNNIPRYSPISFRGAGAFGYVVEAYDEKNDCRVAIKRTHKVGKKLSREYKVLSELKGCVNIVQMLDTFYTINDDGAVVQNIVFEYVSNSLETEIEKMIKNKTWLNLQEIKSIFVQILDGLIFCSSKSIVHRDLKPENILFNPDDKVVKLCDFGSSKMIYSKKSNSNEELLSENENSDGYYSCNVTTKSTPYIVSRYYRSPELILGCSSYDSCIDIFAAGCIFYELVTLNPLFQGRAEGMQIFEQMAVLGHMPNDYLSKFPSGKVFSELINKIESIECLDIAETLQLNPNINSQTALELKDLILKMISWWPHERPSALQCKNHSFLQKKIN